MHNFRPGHLLGAAALGAALLLAACIPEAAPPTTTTTTIATPTPPSIDSFGVVGTVTPAPSLVTLGWTVTDPNGDPLTCRVDTDGDGTDDVVIASCNGTGSRNVEVPVEGERTARLTVQDSTFAPVVATRTYVVAAGSTEPFDVELRGVESLSPAEAAAFTSAKDFWESAVVRGIADAPSEPRPPCLPAESADLPPVIDDVIIDVAVTPIDGLNGILGQAGPTCFETSDDLPRHGIMEFDSADVADLLSTSSFDEVVLHEMGHVLGIGTLWDTTLYGGHRKVIWGAGSTNPVFTGSHGVAAYAALGGSGSVPVESLGGVGTRDAHWRESVFGNELMTGWLSWGDNPASAMTISSLADLGYRVTLSVAQPYSLPFGAAARRAPDAPTQDGGIVLRPVPGPT